MRETKPIEIDGREFSIDYFQKEIDINDEARLSAKPPKCCICGELADVRDDSELLIITEDYKNIPLCDPIAKQIKDKLHFGKFMCDDCRSNWEMSF